MGHLNCIFVFLFQKDSHLKAVAVVIDFLVGIGGHLQTRMFPFLCSDTSEKNMLIPKSKAQSFHITKLNPFLIDSFRRTSEIVPENLISYC